MFAFLSQVKDQPHLCYPQLLGDQQGAATKLAGRPCLAAQGQGDINKTDKYVTISTCRPCLLWRVRLPARRCFSGYSRLFCSLGRQLVSLLLEWHRQGQEHRREEVSWDGFVCIFILRSTLTAFTDVFIKTCYRSLSWVISRDCTWDFFEEAKHLFCSLNSFHSS